MVPCVVQYRASVWCYEVWGTELGYGAMRSARMVLPGSGGGTKGGCDPGVRTEIAHGVRTEIANGRRTAIAHSVRTEVGGTELAYGGICSPYAMLLCDVRTKIAYAARRCAYHECIGCYLCAVLKSRMLLGTVRYNVCVWCYALCGTDLRYLPTQALRDVQD
eukprot:958688-Rhodomonas_salina.3